MKEKIKYIGTFLVGASIWIGIFYLSYHFSGKGHSYNPNNGDDGEYYQDSQDEESTENENGNESSSDDSNSCGYEDGNHSATVEYYNPDTGHSGSYTLEVEVEDCEVTTIYFPKGGWLDNSHISPTELDEDGTCTIEDDRGRTFDIQIDD